jgi:gentisate 1,2-dioxygenase
MPRKPQPQAIPYLWRWADIAQLAHRAAKLVPIERGGERRVIAFMNPGLGGNWAATSTLWAGVQILLPSETAPSHQADAVLFSVQVTPILHTLELHREQPYEADAGHQTISREFCP